MKRTVRAARWIVFAILVAIFLVSLLNLFGPMATKTWSGTALGVLLLIPVPLLIASNLIGGKHIVPSLVALLGAVFVFIDVAISLLFEWNVTASWIRWLLESIVLLVVVSLLTRRSTGRGKGPAPVS